MTSAGGCAFAYQGSELELFARAARWKSYLARHITPYCGRHVVEVGAGLGATTKVLCRDADEWLCLEPDAAMAAAIAGEVAAGRLPKACRAEAATARDLAAVRPGQFDTVLYVDVLEHLADDRAELAIASSLLAPGGHLVVLAPAFQFLFTAFDTACGHFRRYDRKSLLALAPPDCAVLSCRYLDSVGFLASLANRLLMRSGQPTLAQILAWDRVMVPMSRLCDPLVGHGWGRSVLAIWRKTPCAC